MKRSTAPLSGIRVLDLTRHLPGPLATMMMADLGADVIKLEAPQGGDPIRHMPPMKDGVSAFFLAVGRSKRSLALDLKTDRGRALALRLAASCHVVVEGFRPGVIDRLGLSYEALRREREDIILCSISGYGQTGPDRDTPGHDVNYCARAGLLAQTGQAGQPPPLLGAQVADVAGGSWQALAGLFGALFHRERTGEGQWLDISLADGVLSTMALTMAIQMAGIDPPGRGEGPLTGGLPCYGIYTCRDGRQLAVGALEPQFFDALCRRLGLDDLVGQGLLFGALGQETRDRLQARLAERDRDEWIALLADTEACVEPLLEPAEVMAHPQYAARGMFFELDGPTGPLWQMATPLSLRGQADPHRPPPALGQHSAEVLAELGLGPDEIAELKTDGIIAAPEAG